MSEFSILAANPFFASRSFSTEKDSPLMDKFVQDRDRILYSKEFRRLAGKTQVFVVGFDDNMRNRLTHTIEVAQIAKNIAIQFRLNINLTEAIAFAHDVGHTPFGHIGERILNFITNGCENFYNHNITEINHKGFKHNFQGIKVTSKLEKISNDYDGLNLTDTTLWGILNHTSKSYGPCDHYNKDKICSFRQQNQQCNSLNKGIFNLNFYDKYLNAIHDSSFSFEALVVRIADEIAQRHHDIEDGILAGIIDSKELAELYHSNFNFFLSNTQKSSITRLNKVSDTNKFINDFSHLIINFYVSQLIESSKQQIEKIINNYKLLTTKDWINKKIEISEKEEIFKLVNFSDDFNKIDIVIKSFLKERILNSHLAQRMDGKANFIIRNIFKVLISNPSQLPDSTIITFFKNYLTKAEFEQTYKNKSPRSLSGILRIELKRLQDSNADKKYQPHLIRTITDYIAGTTDSFALDTYKKLYGFDSIKHI